MTETTQPDPQAVEWAEAWLEDNPECRLADLAEVVGAVYGDEVGARAACAVWFADAPEENPHRPLTVADIPAGQGAASLFIATDGRGRLAAWFMRSDGHAMHLLTDPGPHATAAEAALWGHLAAHLPSVTDATEEADLSPLFDTPQIHTDTDGRHWDETGREHRAVDVGGEVTYQPTDTTEEST